MSRIGRTIRRRGMALIATLWVVIALTGLVLVLGFSMRVEAMAQANRTAAASAEAALRGAEQFVLAAVAVEIASPGASASISFEARKIGDCTFWVLRPDTQNAQNWTYAYGLTDEAAKLDLNSADVEMMMRLPGMTQELAESIVDWRDPDSEISSQGGEDEYYLSLPEPYRAKNDALETVEELWLIKGATPEILLGLDRNRNGVIDAREARSGTMAGSFGPTDDTARGLLPFVTVYGRRATQATAGQSQVDVNNRDTAALRELLNSAVSEGRAALVLERTRDNRPFANVFDYHFRVELTKEEFTSLFPRLTARTGGAGGGGGGARPTPININTAPREVLLALPGLDDADVSAILAHQATSAGNPDDLTWLIDALPREKVVEIGGLVTGRSTYFSADIVAVSADGRAFKRCRIVIDGRQGPPRIVYRRDLTDLGWPLPPEVRAALRAGERVQAAAGSLASPQRNLRS